MLIFAAWSFSTPEPVPALRLHFLRQLRHHTALTIWECFSRIPIQDTQKLSILSRVVAKSDYLDRLESASRSFAGAEPWPAQQLYEKFYCARDEPGNRFKEQMCLFADSLSTDELKGNQLRLYFSALPPLWSSFAAAGVERHQIGPIPNLTIASAIQNRTLCASATPYRLERAHLSLKPLCSPFHTACYLTTHLLTLHTLPPRKPHQIDAHSPAD